MITPKRHNTVEAYPIATLLQHLQHALTPTQRDRLHWLLFARIALGTLAQTRVCLYLAQLTSIAPNTWRQRLKRFRQQPFPEQTLFPPCCALWWRDCTCRKCSSPYTNRRARVHKFLRVQNPPTPRPLPPCQGGEGRGA
jgi:hypothetical protein